MPVFEIPFSQFVPDGGRLVNPGLLNADNVAPFSQSGFVPISTLTKDFGRAGAPALILAVPQDSIQQFALGGACVFIPSSDQAPFNYIGYYYKVFVGSVVGISGREDKASISEWKISIDGTTALQATHAITAADIVQAEGWFFTVYGDSVIAVAGHSAVPLIYIDATNDLAGFVALSSGGSVSPQPKFVSSIGLRLLVANTKEGATVYPNRVRWSATDNVRYFGEANTDPALRTGHQDLNDEYGPITGLVGGSDYAYIAKARCWYRMDFGGPFDFQFKPFAIGHGCLFPHSIVKFGGDIYFWGPYGPAVIRGVSDPEPLGLGIFNRSLKDGSWILERGLGPVAGHPTHLLQGFVDEENEIVGWSYNALNANEESDPNWISWADTVFLYNVRYNRGSVISNLIQSDELTEDGDEAGYEPLTSDPGFPTGIDWRADPDATYPTGFRPAVPFFAPYQPNLDGFSLWAPLLRIHWILLSKGYEFKSGPDFYNNPVWVYAYGANEAAPAVRLRTGCLPVDADTGADGSVKRVRLHFSTNVGGDTPVYEIRLSTLKNPSEQPSAPVLANKPNDRGWLTFPSAPNAPLVQFDVRIYNPIDVGEIEKLEVEVEFAGARR